MDVLHPFSKYEIAQLRHEERLVRAQRVRLAAALEAPHATVTRSRHRLGTLGRLVQLMRLRGVEPADAIAPASRP
jgi:hypothetical protein